jgi:hypothetical protein
MRTANAPGNPGHCQPRSLLCGKQAFQRGRRGKAMKNPLDSLWGTIISGVILTAILYYVVKNFLN